MDYIKTYTVTKQDIRYLQAKKLVKGQKKVTSSFLQRKIRMSYIDACQIISRLERDGIIPKEEEKQYTYEEVKEFVIKEQKVSIALFHRKLGKGYSRWTNMMQLLEEEGVISKADKRGRRRVLIKNKN